MKRYFKNIAYLFAAASLLFTACEDIDPLVEGLEKTTRVFSPSDVEVRVFNSVNARIYWDDVKNAERYNVAFFVDSIGQDLTNPDFDSSTFIQADYNIGSTTSSEPYIAYNLPQDTALTVYVQAISLIEGTANSKWTPFYFETKAENIISGVETTNSVIRLSWEAGTAATTIVLTNTNTKEEVSHELTSTEITTGKATVNAVAGTEYQISIYNRQTVRGTTLATTKPEGTTIEAGADLEAAITAANDGDVLLLKGGVYGYGEERNIKLDKSITIINADDASRPTLQAILFTLNATDINVTLQGLDVDGLNGGDSHTIVVGDVATLGDVRVEDCSFANYQKGLFYGNYAVEVASVTFHNNILSNFACNGADFIDIRKSWVKKLVVTHNTFNTVASAIRDLIRYDNIGKDVEVVFNNNTVYNSSGKRILYIRNTGTITAHSNLITNPTGEDNGLYYSNQSSTPKPDFANNYYYEAAGTTDSSQIVYDESGTTLSENPCKRADRGDFSVNSNLSGDKIGASRWW